MVNAVRIQHGPSGRNYVVADGKVYGDLDGDGRIAKSEQLTQDPAGTSIAALTSTAQYFADVFENPYPGTRGLDASLKSDGRLNSKEIAQFNSDPKGVAAKRSGVWSHLDFFDRKSNDGNVTVKENWSGWRALGYSFVRSAVGTAASAAIFGSARNGFAVDIEEIQSRRPKRPSGIYDKQTGQVDRAKLDEYLKEFDAKGGTMTHDELNQVLKDKAQLGTVPKGQFKSFMELCERMNGNKTVTKAQFEGLYDGSFLYLAEEINKTRKG